MQLSQEIHFPACIITMISNKTKLQVKVTNSSQHGNSFCRTARGNAESEILRLDGTFRNTVFRIFTIRLQEYSLGFVTL